MSFSEFKTELVARARDFVNRSGKCRDLIAENTSNFIVDGSTILVHSYSVSLWIQIPITKLY